MKNEYLFKKKVQELKNHIIPTSSSLIVTHDYPDPDCIAAAFGMQLLLSHWGVKTSQITFGGFVGRAENRAMIRYLNIQTIPLMLIEFSDYDRTIVVDTFPGDGNISLESKHYVDAVIDHHPHKQIQDKNTYYYIQNNIGSTSTIITKFLISEQCTIPSNVATALFYGIKTDTKQLARNVSSEDIECYKYLLELINHQDLSNIESPDRDTEYFKILHRAVESMTFYDDTYGYTHLNAVSTPDYIAEIADLFHSIENLEWMICSAIFKKQIYFSIRSRHEETAGINAKKIAKKMKGFGGGHATMAAGRIPIENSTIEEALLEFTNTLMTIFKIGNRNGKTIL
jgi:nanoRNase/pAp phosphatase (c-di-AMP/oligoRNAs hydrolase)